MFELTNEQRKCFALPPVQDSWKRIEVKKGPYDTCNTYAYLDGQQIMKVVQVYDVPGQEIYREYSGNQSISTDGTKLLPKTTKGKPQNFIASYLENKTPVGMAINFNRDYASIINNDSEQCYYRSSYCGEKIESLGDFKSWVEDWCKNTGEKELKEVVRVAELNIGSRSCLGHLGYISQKLPGEVLVMNFRWNENVLDINYQSTATQDILAFFNQLPGMRVLSAPTPRTQQTNTGTLTSGSVKLSVFDPETERAKAKLKALLKSKEKAKGKAKDSKQK